MTDARSFPQQSTGYPQPGWRDAFYGAKDDDSYPQPKATPTTELQNLEPTSKPSRDAFAASPSDDLPPTAASFNRGQVPDRWPYFLERFTEHDPDGWGHMTIGALVRIAQETSVDAVSYALAIANLTEPKIGKSAYGWVRATARSFAELGV